MRSWRQPWDLASEQQAGSQPEVLGKAGAQTWEPLHTIDFQWVGKAEFPLKTGRVRSNRGLDPSAEV